MAHRALSWRRTVRTGDFQSPSSREVTKGDFEALWQGLVHAGPRGGNYRTGACAMILLLVGIFLWWAAHLFKRLAPARRAAMDNQMGSGAKGVFALVLLVSVVLMVLGFRWSEWVPV